MATTKSKTYTATASYEKDTAKGKKRVRVEGEIVGTLYLPANTKIEGDFKLTLTPES